MPPPPPPPEYKHFCRVCNKGFTCGSALGGHMRAHGASGDDVLAVDDDEEEDSLDGGGEPRGASDDLGWDAAAGTSSSTHAYALRANPNRLVRSCQVCKNCGKEFTSWELFLEHGKCNDSDDDARAAEADGGSPPRSSSPISDDEDPAAVAAAAWSKGKRSRRVKLMAAAADDAPSSRRSAQGEEEDLANCLVMLSSSNIEHAATVTETSNRQQEPSAPARREVDRGPQLLQPISFLAPAAPDPVMALPSAAATIQYTTSPTPRGLFECKACKRVFTSHQALGGHRASHKKVKGCFAARFDTSEAPVIRHAATNADPNNAESTSTHASAEAKPAMFASTDAGTSDASAALSMALAATAVHEPPPVAATFNVAAAPSNKKNTKMHECSVCHRLFTSGQALGGHKRCHWLTTSSTADPTNPVANLTVPPLTEDLVGAVRHQLMLRPMADPPEPALDLTIAAKPSPLRPEAGSSSFHLDASVLLPSAAVPGGNAISHRNRTSTTSGHDGNNDATASAAAEDEADSTVAKKARLTDLKDVVHMDGEASEPWLQVGIGSASSAGGGDDKSSRD